MPWKTPSAVPQPESPAPPCSWLRPNTYWQRSAMTSISAAEVFMSAAVRYVPPSEATMSP